MSFAVRASNLTKMYQIYARPADRFVELMTFRNRHRSFPALRDVSFAIETGETFGVVGQNGAGKSTLLKLVSGVARATSGTLMTTGKVASILELGSGFHPEFTGRDNALLNAAILGLDSAEVREALPRIIEFSELGAFMDRPVRTYSSGMHMRLAFSIAVMVDPDILIIDEALAVGDGHFQKKCVNKIRGFQERGKTILFCSHALYFITTLCNRTMWLHQGEVRRIGDSVDVAHDYESFLLEQNRGERSAPALEKPTTGIEITHVEVTRHDGTPSSRFASGDEVVVRVRLRSADPRRRFHLQVAVVRAADEFRCCRVSTAEGRHAPLEGRSTYDVQVRLRGVPLAKGDFGIVVFAEDEERSETLDRTDLIPAFSIEGDRYEIGVVRIAHAWAGTARPQGGGAGTGA